MASINVSDEAVEAAAKAAGLVFDEPANARDIEYMRTILEAAAPFIRAEALEEAADVAHDKTVGMDGSAIRVAENRGFMQRHNVSAAARWLRRRAAEMRQG